MGGIRPGKERAGVLGHLRAGPRSRSPASPGAAGAAVPAGPRGAGGGQAAPASGNFLGTWKVVRPGCLRVWGEPSPCASKRHLAQNLTGLSGPEREPPKKLFLKLHVVTVLPVERYRDRCPCEKKALQPIFFWRLHRLRLSAGFSQLSNYSLALVLNKYCSCQNDYGTVERPWSGF